MRSYRTWNFPEFPVPSAAVRPTAPETVDTITSVNRSQHINKAIPIKSVAKSPIFSLKATAFSTIVVISHSFFHSTIVDFKSRCGARTREKTVGRRRKTNAIAGKTSLRSSGKPGRFTRNVKRARGCEDRGDRDIHSPFPIWGMSFCDENGRSSDDLSFSRRIGASPVKNRNIDNPSGRKRKIDPDRRLTSNASFSIAAGPQLGSSGHHRARL